jgi:hypothetical protein
VAGPCIETAQQLKSAAFLNCTFSYKLVRDTEDPAKQVIRFGRAILVTILMGVAPRTISLNQWLARMRKEAISAGS